MSQIDTDPSIIVAESFEDSLYLFRATSQDSSTVLPTASYNKQSDSMTSWLGLLRTPQYDIRQIHLLRTYNRGLERDNDVMREDLRVLRNGQRSFRDKIRKLSKHRDQVLDVQEQLRVELQSKDVKIRELNNEILQYKVAISDNTRLERQMSDTTIQSSFNALFYIVRDWALQSVRGEYFDFDLLSEDKVEWIQRQMPGGKDQPSNRKMNILITLFAEALVSSTTRGLIFGAATKVSGCPVASANYLHTFIKNVPGISSEKRKQWTMTTNDFLSRDEDVMINSQRAWTRELVQFCTNLFGDSSKARTAAQRLEAAVHPHISFVRALPHQETEYLLWLPEVIQAGEHVSFAAKYMEEVNGEEEEEVRLSAWLFPVLFKYTNNQGEDKTETVVCKGKVVCEI